MKDQRGSVTVIAIVMLLFLMVIAIAWLPMMTMEKTAASSDYREQQAWYAAEAGYKRAVANLKNKNKKWESIITKEADIQKNDSGYFGHLSMEGNKVDQNGVWYAIGIMKDIGLDVNGQRQYKDIDEGYEPKDNTTYLITAVGSCQGVRKVIRKDYTIGDNGGTGGGGSVEDPEEPEPPQQENVYLADALVAARGAVSIYFVNGDNSGKIYGSSIVAEGFNKVGVVPFGSVKYYVQDEVFKSSYYKNIQDNADQDLKDGSITKGASYYRSADIKDSNISVAGSSVLLTDGDIKLQDMTINVDSGVLQIIANGKIEIENVQVTGAGQLTVISKRNLKINDLGGNSKILLIGNTVNFTNPNVTKCFISSKGSISMDVKGNDKFEYRGQMQAAGSVSISGNQLQQNKFELHFEKIADELIFPPMQ